MKTLILNIGNTHVQMCDVCDFEKITEIPTHEFKLEDISSDTKIAASSVVPEFTHALEERGAFIVSDRTAGDIDFSKVDVSTLGKDRIANAAYLVANNILPGAVIDFGTAINCEIVDRNRVFTGGLIMPGRLLMRKSLNLFTAQLPEIDFFDGLPDFPGTNTLDALRLGTDGVLIAAIRDLISNIRKAVGSDVKITACGGDREFFIRNIGGMEDGTDSFTLKGIYGAFISSQKTGAETI